MRVMRRGAVGRQSVRACAVRETCLMLRLVTLEAADIERFFQLSKVHPWSQRSFPAQPRHSRAARADAEHCVVTGHAPLLKRTLECAIWPHGHVRTESSRKGREGFARAQARDFAQWWVRKEGHQPKTGDRDWAVGSEAGKARRYRAKHPRRSDPAPNRAKKAIRSDATDLPPHSETRMPCMP